MVPSRFPVWLLVLCLAAVSNGLADESPKRAHGSSDIRQTISLNGEWLFQREGSGDDWRRVKVPNSFEMHEGTDFDGVGWYRRPLPQVDLQPGQRVLVRFHGAATQTTVWCRRTGQDTQRSEDVLVGEHLGGWTPFDCDVTAQLLNSAGPVELRVRVDELPGHNSQGFLPVFAPHFGGLWQDVELLIVPELRLDDLSVLTVGNRRQKTIRVDCTLQGETDLHRNAADMAVAVSLRERNSADEWSALGFLRLQQNSDAPSFSGELPVVDPKTWSPEQPHLYDVRLQLMINGQPGDKINSRCAFRDIEVRGDQLLLNDKPLQVRGILNWGYAPPDVCPSRDPEFWKQEIALLRSYGFNLMKFCLWVPPRGYLELADEMGVLTWMEYPTWHSQWTQERQPELEREFTEFFEYDRNHPSIVLRSLTCETGPSADLGVIRSLYDRCHRMIPGSVVEDDSSWIEWNRVHDFYDDHPYGNNHTWPATLDRLKAYVQEHGVKPLVLGEAIAADTWVDPGALLSLVGKDRPFWLPGFLDDNIRWLNDRHRLDGSESLQRLRSDSLRYAMLMRKYQIEEYRQRVPAGGYVVSVIRDFPFAAMGLMDFRSQPKWAPRDWNWHGDSLLILQTPDDRRGFLGGQTVPVEVQVSHFGAMDWGQAQLTVSFGDQVIEQKQLSEAVVDGVTLLAKTSLDLPSVNKPERRTVQVRLEKDGRSVENSWDLWALPQPVRAQGSSVTLHQSLGDQFNWMKDRWNVTSGDATAEPVSAGAESTTDITIASKLDQKLLSALEKGARVLLLPGAGPGSLPRHQHWFLRGGPVFGSHSLLKQLPPEALLELQHFDLGDAVVTDLQWLEQIDPIMMLWDNHDIRQVKTHGLLFETGVGGGRLMVCALNVSRPDNEAGVWLLDQVLSELSADKRPRRSLTSEQLKGMRNKLVEKKMDLTNREWKFRTDPNNQGLVLQWQFSQIKDPGEWKSMSIGKHWEGLGYESLDGWAWYRIDVELDETWDQQPVHVWIEGADDFYELYCNGLFFGSVGDIPSKQTAFEERRSFEVTESVGDDRTLHIVIRVYDWYGAGGLFRPIHVSTTPLSTDAAILN